MKEALEALEEVVDDAATEIERDPSRFPHGAEIGEALRLLSYKILLKRIDR